MASIKDVATRAGVSTATVSRVINNHPSVTVETRRAVHEAMDFLCYVPNRNAVQLSGKCSGLIGVVVPNLINPHFCELLATLEEEARYVARRFWSRPTRISHFRIGNGSGRWPAWG